MLDEWLEVYTQEADNSEHFLLKNAGSPQENRLSLHRERTTVVDIDFGQ